MDRNEKRACIAAIRSRSQVAEFAARGAYSPESTAKIVTAIKNLVIAMLEVIGTGSAEELADIEACRESSGDLIHWIAVLKKFVEVMP